MTNRTPATGTTRLGTLARPWAGAGATALAMLLAPCHSAKAQIDYFEDFNNGDGGWVLGSGTTSTNAPCEGGQSARRSIGPGASTVAWTLTSPPAGLSTGQEATLSFVFGRTQTSFFSHMRSWWSTDGVTWNDQITHAVSGTGCASFTRTFTPPAGQPVLIRLEAARNADFANTHVFRFDEVRLAQCAVAVGGTVDTVPAICTGRTATLTATGTTPPSGVTYFQWEDSDDGGTTDPWAPATGGSGANTPTYTTPLLNAARHYRLRVGCMMGGPQDLSNAVEVAVDPCLGIADAVDGPRPMHWLGQDADGSHLLRTSGATVLGWEVLDAAGRATGTMGGSPTSGGLHRIMLDGASSGAYLVRVRTDRGTAVVRLMHVER